MNEQIDPAAALKTLPAFSNTSLRLLDDLAERLLLADDADASGGLMSVLRGGSLAAGGDGASLWERRRELLKHLLAASPALAHSVAGGSVKGLLGTRYGERSTKEARGTGPRERWLVEALWVCAARDFEAPRVALTHLLAAATARLFGEAAIVVTLGAHPSAHHYAQDGVFDVSGMLPISRIATLSDRKIVRAVCVTPRPRALYRIFFVDPDDREPPPAFPPQRFHRIVYLTRDLPTHMPAALRGWLKAALFPVGDAEPGFSAFVPSVALPINRPAPVSWLRAAWNADDVADFRTVGIPDGPMLASHLAVRSGPSRRIQRDLCRMQLDLDAIGSVWNAWQATELPDRSFPAAVARLHPSHTAPVERWARAVSNRQVGVGLSGGGACAYRAVPLLSILVRRLGVPIDVIGGVSGGSVIGAYFATYGLDGLRLAIDRGPAFSRIVTASMFDSRAIALQVDADLGGARIEELETRFVPVTTKLPMDERPPHGAVVVRGTCGAGVRVSGSAPGGFAPTQIRGSRFTDGFASTMIPGRVLRSYGADVVLACNCIPGPGEGQPLEQSTLGRLLYHGVPFFGRMVDAWVSIAYLFQETSRRAGTDGDVFVEFPSEDVPLLEMTQWGSAMAIAHRARTEHGTRLWDEARNFGAICRQVGRRPA